MLVYFVRNLSQIFSGFQAATLLHTGYDSYVYLSESVSLKKIWLWAALWVNLEKFSTLNAQLSVPNLIISRDLNYQESKPMCHKLRSEMNQTKVHLQKFINEKAFYFFTCIFPDYVSQEGLKEFWKNSHFENMRADFLRRCQNSLQQTSPEMMHFQP